MAQPEHGAPGHHHQAQARSNLGPCSPGAQVKSTQPVLPTKLTQGAQDMTNASEELCAAAFHLREAMADLAHAAARSEQTIGLIVEMQMRRTAPRRGWAVA